MEEIVIKPLSEESLQQASSLALKVFHSNSNDEDYPPKWFKISLSDKKNEKMDLDVTSIKYWVALDSNKKVHGIVGLYTLSYDEKEAYWLGWYLVDPKSRGKGIGKLLLESIIKKSKKQGKKYLRLYTSNDPNEKRANEIYDKLGFTPIKSEKINKIIADKKFRAFTKNLVYKELKLS
jgi:GNAT superfamily N-acetyltransferase